MNERITQPSEPLTAAMDNVLAWKLGEIVNLAAKSESGDLIDRGLTLRRLLEERGFFLVTKEEIVFRNKSKIKIDSIHRDFGAGQQ